MSRSFLSRGRPLVLWEPLRETFRVGLGVHRKSFVSSHQGLNEQMNCAAASSSTLVNTEIFGCHPRGNSKPMDRHKQVM